MKNTLKSYTIDGSCKYESIPELATATITFLFTLYLYHTRGTPEGIPKV